MPGSGIDLSALGKRREQRHALRAGTGYKGVLKKALEADNGAPSVLQQFKDIAQAAPSGILHLARDAARSAPALAIQSQAGLSGNPLVNRAYTKTADRLSSVPGVRLITPERSLSQEQIDEEAGSKGGFDRAIAQARSANPLGTQFAQSLQRTGGDIIHPSRFAKAAKEGTIVGKVLEDLGNVSLVGGAVAKGFTTAAEKAAVAGNAERAASFTKAANIAKRTASLTGETANAPVAIPRAVLRGAGKALGEGFEQAVTRLAPESRMLQEHRWLTREGRAANRFGRYGETSDGGFVEGVGLGEQQRAGGNAARLREAAQKRLGDESDQAVVEAARRAIPETSGRGLAAVMPALEADPALAARVIAGMGLPEGYGLPELRKIADLATDQLDPELAARIQRAREIIAPITQERTAGFQDPRTFAGEAPGQQMIDEQVRGYEPLSLVKDRISEVRAGIEGKRDAKLLELQKVAPKAARLEREIQAREAFAKQSKPVSANEGYRAGVQTGRAQERVTQAQRRATAAGSRLDRAADEYFAAAGKQADGSLVDKAAATARSARAEADAQVLRKVDPDTSKPLGNEAFEGLATKVAHDPAVYDELAAQYHDALKFDDDLAQLEKPSKEAIQSYRQQVLDQADQAARSLQGELVRLGGVADEKGNVTFPIRPRRGTPEWDWWEQLSPKERSKIGAHYMRGSARPLGIDELASSLGMGVDEWAQKFRETVGAFEEARGLRRESGRISQKDLAGRLFKDQAGEPEQYRPRFSSSEIEAILTRADEIANPPVGTQRLSAADQRATGAAFQRARTARENLNRAVAEYERADRSTARGEARAAESLARAQQAFDRSTAEVAKLRTRAEATHVLGKPQSPMSQAQRDAEMRQLGAARVQAKLPILQRDRLTRQIERANKDIAELPAKYDAQIRQDPMSYPKRLRPAMAVAQGGQKALRDIAAEFEAQGNPQLAEMFKRGADEILARPEEWQQYGIDAEHAIGGKIDLRVDERLNVRGRKADGTLVQQRTGTYEHFSDKPTEWVTSFREAAIKEAHAAADQVRNRTSFEYAQRFGQTAEGLGYGNATKDQIWAAMRSQGYEPWDQHAKEGTMVAVLRDKVNAQTVWLPAGTMREFQSYWDQGAGGLMATIEAFNRMWKPAVLVANPKWQINNIISGFIGATFSAGESPATIVRTFRKAWKINKEHPESLPEFSRSTLTPEERTYLSMRGEKVPRTLVGKGYSKFAQKSYNLNQFFDNTYKSAVYLAKKEKGATTAEAIRMANKAIGDFDRLSPMEQRYVKAVVPFYAWAKHITRLTTELAVDHPARVAWALNIGNLFGDDQSQLPDFLKGSLKVDETPGWLAGATGQKKGQASYLPLAQLNPFSDPTGRNMFVSPAAALQAVSPAIKLAWAAGTGGNLSRSDGQMRRPGDTKAGPLITRPNELKNYALSQVPLLRFARDVGPGPGPVARYDQGGKYVVNGQYLKSQNRAGALANMVLPGVPRSFNVEEDLAKKAKAKAREEATLKAARKRRELKR